MIKQNQAIVEILESLKKFTNVNIFGEKGIGKSILAAQLKQELSRRPDLYPDGIFIFDASEVV